ncbi:hypothetical protein SUGI_1421000 [Cryptomeria japonica]|uniref:Glycosyltransferase N-terminal domain-containing protein n=1 Tax=Cryptomeria japonica TaxID=3369 RepID=A0AAD3NU83_CRYJA|nr:UDP-glycosyltransferase 83A1-like [Cryptomeria japonica]XP_059071595.1 UDP-glycosyltransferase 83A1-like [Cryptomeria japonica]XP_059071756.1 UDP-glycosyltransferase 83A1-like [Cryptomeria japonica]XP_059071764.1 UDP-glycosyltransferase 83A1-like [Cryptomeria japonica]GLJ57852.1 hypothetical protein SUGI_1381230 [Cryptomeria japonica]GLJ58113.1 hypothetical protein SUGI_1420870 [Cryptomeria japonica]GLJ58124.1 hypothetical protein SUGI_1421000 [Cryptomeria japonica]
MAPHALLVPFPAQGHINPMMQLAWKLVSHGFLVTFLNSDSNHNRMLKANTLNSLRDNIRMISVPFQFPAMDTPERLANAMELLEKGMGPSVIDQVVQEINAKEEENKVTCIIANVWMCFGLQPVAMLRKVSLAFFHTGYVSLFAILHITANWVSHGILPSDGIPKEDKTIQYLPSMPPLHPGELHRYWAGEYMFRKGIRMAEEIKHTKWMLFNSFLEIEAPVVETLSKEVGVYPIGPLIAPEFLKCTTSTKVQPSFWKDETECLQWLDKQCARSVIYISFGSSTVLSEKQVEELALGVEATQRPFLWVESITMGVPMLCWPYIADQFLNRMYVVDAWKLGLPLNANSQGILEKGEFVKSVEILLESKQGLEIREESRKLKIIARDVIEEGGSSWNNFNLFVTAMKRPPNE